MAGISICQVVGTHHVQTSQAPDSRSLSTILEAKQLRVSWDSRPFIPICCLHEYLTEEKVVDQLRSLYTGDPPDRKWIDRYSKAICANGKNIFAILLCGTADVRIEDIEVFLADEGITDQDFPLVLSSEQVTSEYTAQNGPFLLYKKDGVLVSTPKWWKQRRLRELFENQWIVQAPIFSKDPMKIVHYEFNDNHVMPLIEDHERNKNECRSGGYAEVWCVRIHPAHQDLYSLDPRGDAPRLAVKRLLKKAINSQEEFDTERVMLHEIAIRKHPHFIKLLATYIYKGYNHFLFPYANANLRGLWENIGTPNWNQATYLWALEQMEGLASAVHAIHNYKATVFSERVEAHASISTGLSGSQFKVPSEEAKYGRHGDLKPENILWFRAREGGGVLQVTDLGLSRFHRLESRSVVKPKDLSVSPTYAPPEIPLGKDVSRKYDIWSLGCVFLEFVTWLVQGWLGVDRFSHCRLVRAPDGVTDDVFYTIDKNERDGASAVLREEVATWTSELRQDQRCSELLNDLLDLINIRMLAIRSEERISASELEKKLETLVKKSKADSAYLVGCPTPPTNQEIKMPPDA